MGYLMSSIFPDYKQRTANDVRPILTVKQVKSPNCQWYVMTNFDLSKIPTKFEMSPFQRKQSTSHVYRIVESIINNKFFDNTIRCVKKGNGKYEVIDGQHRLKALWILYKQYGITHYTIIMQYFRDNQAREVFRKINSGKRLSTSDHLKTLDDGAEPFFEELRSFCSHSNQRNLPSYIGMLNAFKYRQTKSPRPVKVHELEEVLEKINSEELVHLYRVARATITMYEKSMSYRVYSAGMLRTLFRVGFDNELSHAEYCKLIGKCLADETLMHLIRESFSVHYETIHQKMAEINMKTNN